MKSIQISDVLFQAVDGYPLSGRVYEPQGRLVGTIVVAGATGVQQKLYRRFAEYAAINGYRVLTFDYRGVGRSAPERLKNFSANYLEWGYLDSAAAVDFLYQQGTPLYLVGHSFGGYVPGLLPNYEKVSAAYVFGCGAAWSGWMAKSEAIKVNLLWKFVLPIIVKVKGFMAWSLLGMGDDIPKGVYEAWKHWSKFPHFFFDDPNMMHLRDQYERVNFPCMFATSQDDPWAPPRSRDALASGYPEAWTSTVDICPNERGIGHMGYFLSGMENLWEDALHWFQAGATLEARANG